MSNNNNNNAQSDMMMSDKGMSDGMMVDKGMGGDMAPPMEAGMPDMMMPDMQPGPDMAPMPDGGAPAVEVVTCGSVTPNTTVDMKNNAFLPAKVTISAGQVVRWTNSDAVPHTVTSGNPGDANAGQLYDSGNMGQGAEFCLRFNQAGTYAYWCKVHPTTMADGEVTVQ